MKYNKIIATILSFIMAFMSINTFAGDNSADIVINAPETAKVGDVISVSVDISESSVAGGEFALNYNSDVLKPVAIEKGSIIDEKGFSIELNKDYSKNSCYVLFYQYKNTAISGTLSKVEFEVLEEGTAQFYLSDASFSNVADDEIALNEKTAITVVDNKTADEETTKVIVSNPKAELASENTIRFLSGVNTLKCQEAGFIFEANGKEVKRTSKTVYTSIENSSVKPSDFNGGKYMYAFEISDIEDKDVQIKVAQYVIDANGEVHRSESVPYSISSLS